MTTQPANPQLELVGAGALFAALTAAYLGPAMSWGLAGRLGPDHGDPVFYVYLLKWVASRLPHGFAGLWNPPFFHPMTGVLALSDHLLGPGLVFALLRGLGLAPLSAYNLLYASAFLLAGWSCWWVLRRSGLSFWAAAFGASFFAFGHFRWDEQSHFNVLRTAWIPLVLWSFDRLLAAPSGRRALAFAAAYAGHLAGSTYLAYLVHFPLAILVLVRRRDLLALRAEPRRALPLAAAAAFALALLAALYLAYAGRVTALHAERDLTELRRYAPVLASFVTVSAHAPFERALPPLAEPAGRGALFPGVLIALAAAVAVAAAWRAHRRPVASGGRAAELAASAAGIALLAAALAAADHFTRTGARRVLGLELHDYRGPLLAAACGAVLLVVAQRRLRGGPLARWPEIEPWPRGLLAITLLSLALSLPLFFWLPWSILPGMQGMRIPHRFYAFAALGIAFAAGRGLDRLRAARPARWAQVAVIAAFVAGAALEHRPRLGAWTPFPDEPELPADARFLAEATDVVAWVELPMFGDWRDLTTMYRGTLHWKPLVNGSSSYLPYERESLAAECSALSTGCLERLREWRVSHLVSRHPSGEERPGELRSAGDARRFLPWAARLAELERTGHAVPVFRSDEATVFRLDGEAGR